MSGMLSSERRPARQFGCEDGQSLVETAISVAVFLTVIVATMWTCLTLYEYNFVTEAAREASRYAIVRGSECSYYASDSTSPTSCQASVQTIQNFTKGISFPAINANQLTVNVNSFSQGTSGSTWNACSAPAANTSPPTCDASGDMIQVVVSYPVALPWENSTIMVSSTSSMVISQ